MRLTLRARSFAPIWSEARSGNPPWRESTGGTAGTGSDARGHPLHQSRLLPLRRGETGGGGGARRGGGRELAGGDFRGRGVARGRAAGRRREARRGRAAVLPAGPRGEAGRRVRLPGLGGPAELLGDLVPTLPRGGAVAAAAGEGDGSEEVPARGRQRGRGRVAGDRQVLRRQTSSVRRGARPG